MAMPPTLLDVLTALALVGVGIVIGEVVTARRGRPRGLPFDPRCRR
jgi:hypothetical protein